MKRILCLLIALLFISSTPANAEQFITGFEDIPLMPGLKQLENQNFSFGNEETGFSEAIITANKSIEFNSIQNFYANSLPKLGWRVIESSDAYSRFARENDILEISRLSSHPLKVSISLKSKN